MFGTPLECGIKAVKVCVQDVQGREVRRCRVVLVHELTAAIARDLGEAAVALREHLRDNEIEKAVIPIDALAALGAFTAAGGGGRDRSARRRQSHAPEGQGRRGADRPARVRVRLAGGRVALPGAPHGRDGAGRADQATAGARVRAGGQLNA